MKLVAETAVAAVATGAEGGPLTEVPVPLTATLAVAPPPEMLILPVFNPVDCGVNLAYTLALAKVAEV